MLEAVETVTAWLNDSTYGVAVKLAAIPTLAGDATPTIAAVYSEYADDFIAQDKEPLEVPCLLVLSGGEIDWATESGLPDPPIDQGTGVRILVVCVARDAVGASARRAGGYMVRAVKQSLRDLNGHAGNDARSRRNLDLVEIARMREIPLRQALGRGSLAGMLEVICNVIEDAP